MFSEVGPVHAFRCAHSLVKTATQKYPTPFFKQSTASCWSLSWLRALALVFNQGDRSIPIFAHGAIAHA